MNIIKSQTIVLILILEKIYNEKIFFNIADGNYFRLQKNSVGQIFYENIISPTQIFNELPINSFTLEEILKDNNNKINNLFTKFYGSFTGNMRTPSESFTGNLQANTGTFTENLQTISGNFIDKHGNINKNFTADGRTFSGTAIEKVAENYQGVCREIMLNIENSTEYLLKSKGHQTASNAKKNYSKAILLADKNKIDALVDLNKKIQLSYKKSKRRKLQNKIDSQNLERKRKRKIIFYTTLFLIIIISFSSFFIKRKTNKYNNKNKIEIVETQQSKTYTYENIITEINNFCLSNDTTLTNWRVQYISNNLVNQELTDKELKEQIKILSIYK